jgi:alkanesulfonate monooxygenase
MRIEFSHVPGPAPDGHGAVSQPFFFDPDRSGRKLRAMEGSGFDRVVIDDAAGLFANMDITAALARSTAGVGLVLSHWAGSIEPTVAARQIAALDTASGGRLSLRIVVDTERTSADGAARGHQALFDRTDEYLVLLKRLWSNDRPFDHEGRFYSVKQGQVPRKGPQGGDLPIRMSGQSGTALKVAGKHADVFELAPGTPAEVSVQLGRGRAAASDFGRGAKMRYALPVWIDADGEGGISASREARFVRVRGGSSNVAVTLLSYAALGVSEFLVGGLDSVDAIERFGREVAPVLRNSVDRATGQAAPLRPRTPTRHA